MNNIESIIKFIRNLYKTEDLIPLHAPVFNGNEEKYVIDTIHSTYVSYVGGYVNKFEEKIAEYTGSKYAIATVNGTSALHIALILARVQEGDEVITQPVTFVATCNAIKYCNAYPVFVDISLKTLGMDPKSLERFLVEFVEMRDGYAYNKKTGRRIKACVPVHVFGHPVEIDEIVEICEKYNIVVVEDAAEALGSFYKNKHAGTFGDIGILSSNGNKIITTGGGGMILTDDETLAKKAKHITTTAKVSHPYEYFHDEIGYNYRMPNINAALGLAQLENLEEFVKIKRWIAQEYKKFFDEIGIKFFTEPENSRSNYWLNAIILNNKEERDKFLKITNENGIQTRPVWTLIYKLPMYKDCFKIETPNAEYIEEKLVNIPSGVPNAK
jgi:aminotransferase in exopolysaccharide biosynthesis